MAREADLTIGPPRAPEVEATPGDVGLDLDVELEEAPHVDESVVRGLLQGLVGGGLHHAMGDPDVAEHWRFTDRELDDVTPPLTRIINRRPQLRRAVMHGDELTVAVVLAGYTGRNLDAARAAKEARHERERQAEAPPGDRGAGYPGGPGQPGRHGVGGGGVPGASGGGLA